MAKSAKGSAFEREICRQLSSWWTDGENDCVFWRTAGSGGRATIRSKKGIKTANSDGDIMALDPIGEPFLKCFCVEMKRGYSKHTPYDLLDKPKNAKLQVFEDWCQQAALSAINRESQYWLIIARRDKRLALVYFPYHFIRDVNTRYPFEKIVIDCTFRQGGRAAFRQKVVGTQLAHFLSWFKPEDIKSIIK